MLALANRVHLHARPEVREELMRFFTSILGCEVVPIGHESLAAFRFPTGGSISVEFDGDALADEQLRKGAWLEIVCDSADSLKKKVLEAGLKQITSDFNDHFYFAAPGGQIMRILSSQTTTG